MESSSLLSTTFLHAITFLLSPLSSHYPSQVIDALHLALLTSLSRLDISSRPTTLLLSPTAPPPPAIFFALQSLQTFPVDLRVHWADWMLLLAGGNQLVLTIVAGSVQVMCRDLATGGMSTQTVWNANLQARAASPWGSSVRSRSSAPSSSESSTDSVSSRSSSPVTPEDVIAVEAAETVLSGLEDDEGHAIAFSGRGLGYSINPIITKSTALSAAAPEWFPTSSSATTIGRPSGHAKTSSVSSLASQRIPPPVGTKRAPFQFHSRASSRSSTMSSTPSLVSSYSSTSASTSSTINTAALTSTLASLTLRSKTPSALATAAAATSSLAVPVSALVPASPTPSDISDGADATFYLDGSKDQQAVTEYECGKVGVLTGAVMLGVPKVPAKGVKVVAGKAGARRA